ncbi:MAG: heme-copper oxidase subunit III [Verrucomicrobiota bacterium]
MANAAEGSWDEPVSERRRSGISSPVFGMLVFIVTEVMFFAALISAYMVTTANAVQWPPVGQPRLPIEITGLNTLILLASGVMIHIAGNQFEKSLNSKNGRTLFLRGMVLGVMFLAIQGYEWISLLSFGFTMTSNIGGAFFYLVIGSHGLHVLGAVIGLYMLWRKLGKGTMTIEGYGAARIFWYFVVGIWPILYVLVDLV